MTTASPGAVPADTLVMADGASRPTARTTTTHRPGPTLVSWPHEKIPVIAAAFPSTTPSPPSTWPDDRYDVIWLFTRKADGRHFGLLPELVLPQDRDTVIS